MNALDALHRFLVEAADDRVTVDEEHLFRGLRAVFPELAATASARMRLRELLDLLALDGRIVLPEGREHWDRASLPALPRWVRLPREPAQAESLELRQYGWAPELRFLLSARVGVPLVDLLKLQRFFADGGRNRPLVPIKERSLQIFGDEKRLDALHRSSTLFGDGRLTLDALRCRRVAEPLAWARGPRSDQPIIIIENAATWHSFRAWNAGKARYGGVIYGGGNRLLDGVEHLVEIFEELCGQRRAVYFGDLDPHGLRIPRIASSRAIAMGLPKIEPELWCYERLLNFGMAANGTSETPLVADELDLAWIASLSEPISALFAQGKRVAQEHLGIELLCQNSDFLAPV